MDVFEQNERFFLSSLLRGGALGNHFGKPIIIALPKGTMQSWAAHPSMSAEDLPDRSWLPPGLVLYHTSDLGSMLISCYPGM